MLTGTAWAVVRSSALEGRCIDMRFERSHLFVGESAAHQLVVGLQQVPHKSARRQTACFASVAAARDLSILSPRVQDGSTSLILIAARARNP